MWQLFYLSDIKMCFNCTLAKVRNTMKIQDYIHFRLFSRLHLISKELCAQFQAFASCSNWLYLMNTKANRMIKFPSTHGSHTHRVRTCTMVTIPLKNFGKTKIRANH